MATQFIEGFDKYGPVGMNCYSSIPTLNSLMCTTGLWNLGTGPSSSAAANPAIVASLNGVSGSAYALIYYGASSGWFTCLGRSLNASVSRLVGGIRFEFTALNNYGMAIAFYASGTAKSGIQVNAAGTISVCSGAPAGTQLGTASQTFVAGTIHFLEWDITFGSSAAYAVYLDGVAILSGTGNTGSAVNQIWLGTLGAIVGTPVVYIDDLYLFDTTGSVNNAVLLTNPRVETQLPTGDAQTQWANGGSIIGQAFSLSSANNAPGANQIFLRAFTPAVSMTLNSVSCLPQATSSTANFKAVLYSGIGAGAALIAAASTATTGTTAGTALTSSFASGQSLTVGTTYGIGFITDTSVALYDVDSTTTGAKASNTYASGAPATLPAMTSGQPSWVLWGNCSGAATNWESENLNPPMGSISGVSSSTAGNEDLYSFPSLLATPSAVYSVQLTGSVIKSDTNARTVAWHMKSGTADLAGSAYSPTTVYQSFSSCFDTDPATGLAWTAAGVNAATAGPTVAS